LAYQFSIITTVNEPFLDAVSNAFEILVLLCVSEYSSTSNLSGLRLFNAVISSFLVLGGFTVDNISIPIAKERIH